MPRYFATPPRPPVAVFALTLAVFLATRARGQAPLLTRVLDSSTVVRMHFAQGGSAQGSLLASFGPMSSTLWYCSVLAPRCAPPEGVRLPAAMISRLEVQSGTRTGRGFLVGTAVVGIVVVPFYVIVGGSLAEGETRRGLVAKGVLVSALIGGGLGALIGPGHPAWAPAP